MTRPGWRGWTPELHCAIGAPPRCDRDVTQTLRAWSGGLGLRLRRPQARQQVVDGYLETVEVIELLHRRLDGEHLKRKAFVQALDARLLLQTR